GDDKDDEVAGKTSHAPMLCSYWEALPSGVNVQREGSANSNAPMLYSNCKLLLMYFCALGHAFFTGLGS
ncbi:hypothetical protein ACLOJK_006797, partial [Asimina triloba]